MRLKKTIVDLSLREKERGVCNIFNIWMVGRVNDYGTEGLSVNTAVSLGF